MKFISFALFVFITNSSISQDIDLTGRWNGNAYYINTQITNTYELEQDGNRLTGFVYTKTGADSSKFKVKGKIINDKVSLLGTEFVYKTGAACLSQIDLLYSKKTNFESLSGRWKGTMSFSTCAPGVSGRIELFKETSNKKITKMPAVAGTKVDIHKDDFEGVELAKALSERKYYALIIAVDNYADESIQDLDNPVNDARNLANVLNTHYTFDQSNIFTLTNPTRSDIIEEFDKLADKVEERDNFLIFYAGHGIWDEKLNQGFWLPSDASLNSKAQWLSNSTLRDYVSGINSKHTLLITDACFSGSIFKERAVFSNSRAILEMYKLPSRKAMTSGALKTVPDKSVFIKYLNKKLQTNQQPLLSAEQLFQSFKVAVINNSPNGQVPQYGPIGQAGDEGGDFIFLKRK